MFSFFFSDTSPSPYGGQMLGAGLSPMFQGATSPQPQYMFPMDTLPRRTPSPADIQINYNFKSPYNINSVGIQPNHQLPNIPPSITQMPQMNSEYLLQPQNWNIPNITMPDKINLHSNDLNALYRTAAEASNAINNVDTPTGLSSVLDLDSNEFRQLNSEDLTGLDIIAQNLPDSFTTHVSLNDGKQNLDNKQEVVEENMTDSFTTLTKQALESICQLDGSYKPNING